MAVLQKHLLIESVADALCNAAFDLPAGKDGVEHAAHLLHSPEFFDFGGVSHGIDRDLRNLDGPRKGRIRFAAILLVVPEDTWRRFVSA